MTAAGAVFGAAVVVVTLVLLVGVEVGAVHRFDMLAQ